MNLQEFIEKNAGKEIGKKQFVYDHLILDTSITHPRQPFVVLVGIILPWSWGQFHQKIDTSSWYIGCEGELVSFYNWLKTGFIPAAEKHFWPFSKERKEENGNWN